MVSIGESLRQRIMEKISLQNDHLPEKSRITFPESLGEVFEEVPEPDAPPIDTLTQNLKKYVKLEKWKRSLDQLLTECKKEMASMEQPLIEKMAIEGVEKSRVDDMTVSTKSTFYCNKKADEQGVTQQVICAALKELGFGNIVSEGYSASALKAKVKEWLEKEVEIPEEIDKLVNYGFLTQLSLRV